MTALAVGAALLPVLAWGQWSRDAQHAIQFDGILAAKLVSDSLGGVFLYATGGDFRGYCYYVDREGYPVWQRWIDTSPLAAYNQTSDHAICPEPGYVITLGYSQWHTEDGDTSWDIRAQKINSEGEFMWSDSGVSVTNFRIQQPNVNEAYFTVVGVEGDGEGGSIVAWGVDYLNAQWPRQMIIAQRISPDGELLWDEQGVFVFRDSNPRVQASIVADNTGGILAISHSSNIDGIDAQRVSQGGDTLWGRDGISYNTPYSIGIGAGVSDRHGGFYLNAVGIHDGLYSTNVFHFNSQGRQLWGGAEGLVINAVPYQVGGYANSAMVVINDSTLFLSMVGDSIRGYHPIVQSVSFAGEIRWDEPGLYISLGDSIQYDHIGLSSFSSAIYVWHDNRDYNEITASVYAQKINEIGEKVWSDDDVLLLNRRGISPRDVVSDMNGGAILYIGSSYLQYINRDGKLGLPLSIRRIDEPLQIGTLSISIFPNPANSITTLKFNQSMNSNALLSLADIQGRVLTKLILRKNSYTCNIDISNFASGNYLLQLKSKQEIQSGLITILK